MHEYSNEILDTLTVTNNKIGLFSGFNTYVLRLEEDIRVILHFSIRFIESSPKEDFDPDPFLSRE